MENKSHNTSDGPRKLPLKLLEEITNGFAEEQRLGSGAFGDVYKGVLDGEVIAVKRLRFILGNSDKQFENEFGHLSKLMHQNIVQLVGFCDETKKVLVPHNGRMVSAVEIHRALCLEFVPHGSLAEFLSEQCLVHDWHVRFKIIKGICEGLNYLHRFSVMHLDLKPENILLDEEMVPRIADFGLSRLMGEENTKITMSRLGTPGYMPPEFINNQIISTKYDIFSLGVILKRIVSGEMDYFSIAEMGNLECIEHVHNYWEKKLQETLWYASLEVDCKQVRSCIEIAVACTEPARQKRPTIEDIVRKLNKLEANENDSRSQIEQFQDGQCILPRRVILERPSRVVDIASWAEELTVELYTLNSSSAQLGAPLPPSDCIIVAPVPHLTRNVDEGEYNPHYVSIGPLNRKRNPKLAREDDKLRCLQAVLSAASSSTTVEVLLEGLASLEERARSCYAVRFDDMTSKMFVRMLLLDGCYILSRFTSLHPPSVREEVCGDMREAVADIFYLAENQIPFFVLEQIGRLSTLTVNEVVPYGLTLLRNRGCALPVAAPDIVAGNLLHLLHMHLQPTAPPLAMASSEPDGEPVVRWRTATDYYFAGVKFKGRNISDDGNVRCILDVKLNSDGGTLEVPCLHIDTGTWRFLRNLMELEQCNPKSVGSHVTAYCIFMSQIACTKKDVVLLICSGVIGHYLSSADEVAKGFADLCKGIVFDLDDPSFNYLRATCQVLEKRFQSYPRRWWTAWLRRAVVL